MRHITRYITVVIAFMLLFSCENKELCYDHPHGQQILINIHWPEGVVKPQLGMRTNFFTLNAMPSYGIMDFSADGGSAKMPQGASYKSVCYDYYGSSNVYFRNENNINSSEAYCAPLVWASYSRAFPTENTVTEPGLFYVDRVERVDIDVTEGEQVIDFYPENVLKTYTFRIRTITGAGYITAARGAISGMSASYFLASGELAASSSTILFNAVADAANNWITGAFRTFGQLEDTNNFTIEILRPSKDGSTISRTWDVTNQMKNLTSGQEYDIEIIDADITITPYDGDDGGGGAFDATVKEWEEEKVKIGM